MYYVYKEEYDHYMESRGIVVLASSPDEAKDIAMTHMILDDQNVNNVKIKEITVKEGVVCATDSIYQ